MDKGLNVEKILNINITYATVSPCKGVNGNALANYRSTAVARDSATLNKGEYVSCTGVKLRLKAG